jgi:hypothetical protein
LGISAVMLWTTSLVAFGQGTFQNLDFESPILPLTPDSEGRVSIVAALPNWSGYLGEAQQTTVLYNNRYLGTATIDLMGPSGGPILQGQYTVLLQAGLNPSGLGQVGANIAQTGMIPPNAQSLRFLANGPAVMASFGGQTLSLVPLVGDPCFTCTTLFGADISGFAGQTGELRISAPDLSSIGFPNNIFLDNIFFSPEQVPEPRVLGLFALGLLLLGWRHLRRTR